MRAPGGRRGVGRPRPAPRHGELTGTMPQRKPSGSLKRPASARSEAGAGKARGRPKAEPRGKALLLEAREAAKELVEVRRQLVEAVTRARVAEHLLARERDRCTEMQAKEQELRQDLAEVRCRLRGDPSVGAARVLVAEDSFQQARQELKARDAQLKDLQLECDRAMDKLRREKDAELQHLRLEKEAAVERVQKEKTEALERLLKEHLQRESLLSCERGTYAGALKALRWVHERGRFDPVEVFPGFTHTGGLTSPPMSPLPPRPVYAEDFARDARASGM